MAGTLAPGHPGRRTAALAMWAAATLAVGFVAFAALTTRLHAVRSGSPWQDDPYDAVVSFTELLVPALLVLIAARGSLWRRDSPQPLERIRQLLRAAWLSTLLVGCTAAVDWAAVALRADRPLWSNGTPWLVAALAALTAATATAAVLQLRAGRALPQPDPGAVATDWLADLPAVLARLTRWAPARLRPLAERLPVAATVELLRRHATAVIVLLAATVSLGTTAAQVLGEQWSSPVLMVTAFAVSAAGLAVCGLLANAYLGLIAAHPARRSRVRPWQLAALAGAGALPAATGLRDSIWVLLHRPGTVDTPAKFAAVISGAALCVAGVAWLAAIAISRLRRDRGASAGSADA